MTDYDYGLWMNVLLSIGLFGGSIYGFLLPKKTAGMARIRGFSGVDGSTIYRDIRITTHDLYPPLLLPLHTAIGSDAIKQRNLQNNNEYGE